MAKRLHDTDIWEQDWFIDLPSKYKLFWGYVKDKCDNVGIWRPNKGIAQRIIGEPLNMDEFLGFINIDKERIIVLPSGKWFLSDFFKFQYGDTYSPTSQVHKGALKQLLSNGIHISQLVGIDSGNLKNIGIQELKQIAYSKGLDRVSEAYWEGIDRDKDKNKNKEKDKE